MRVRASFRLSAFAMASCLVLALALPGRQARHKNSNPKEPPPTKAASPETAVPFNVGEQLDYRVAWANLMNAAMAHLTLAERRSFYRWQAWHFQAAAHTVEPVRYLYILDDQFDSYTDTATLTSHQYEQYINEQGKQATRIARLSTDHDSPWGPGPMVVVLPGTRDPLAFFYYLRTVDWQAMREVRSPVYDGAKVFDVHAHLEEAQTSVTVAAGTYSASRIGIRLYQGGRELTQMQFTAWLAHDRARTPVLVQGELPVGTVRGELIKAVQ